MKSRYSVSHLKIYNMGISVAARDAKSMKRNEKWIMIYYNIWCNIVIKNKKQPLFKFCCIFMSKFFQGVIFIWMWQLLNIHKNNDSEPCQYHLLIRYFNNVHLINLDLVSALYSNENFTQLILELNTLLFY